MDMRPFNFLRDWLEENANEDHYLFSFQDLRVLFPSHSDSAYRTILSRAAASGVLLRICQGIFIYKKAFRSINEGLRTCLHRVSRIG